MKRFILLAIPALLAVLAQPAIAMDEDELYLAIEDFVGAANFERLDTPDIEDALAPHWLRTALVAPGGDVGPIEKALIVATEAIPSARTRTVLFYGQLLHDEGNGAPYPVSFIEIRHYNLASEIRDDAIKAYGRENVASLDEFGLGEHRAWRFVFQPMMGNAAMLIAASTHEISTPDARREDCNGIPCLDIYASHDDIRPWTAVDATLPSWPALYPQSADDIATPAHAVAELAVLGYWANAESGQYQWTGGEHPEGARGIQPFRFIGIDRNLGQELSIDAVWHETRLNDDELAEIYFRRADIAGEVHFMRSRVTY